MKDGTTVAFLKKTGLQYIWGNPYMLLESDPYREFLTGCITPVANVDPFGSLQLFIFDGDCTPSY
jgi:hypothetical protein